MTLRHSLQGEREARLELRSDDKIFCRIRVNCCSFWSWSSCGCSMNGAAAERSTADNSKCIDFIFLTFPSCKKRIARTMPAIVYSTFCHVLSGSYTLRVFAKLAVLGPRSF